jgi:protein N-terminal methyltransferase
MSSTVEAQGEGGGLDAPEDSRINRDDGRNYWQAVDADVNGMLGGFPYISKVDLRGSRAFLAKLGLITTRKPGSHPVIMRALEGGAG